MQNFYQQLADSYNHLIEKLTGWVDIFILQLPNIVLSVLIGLVSYFLSKYIRKLALKAIKKVTINKTIHNLVGNLTAVIFGIIILFLILSVLNLSGTITKILATAGVLGLAIGLALQDPMNNLFSGVFMSVRQLYKIGDLVETNSYFGKIINIDLRATTLMLPIGQEVVIPNKDVIQNPLVNYSASGMRRVDVECGVSYGDDLQQVEMIVRRTLGQLKNLVPNRPVEVMFTEFGDSSVNFVARFWIAMTSQKDYLVEKSKAIKAIKAAFDDNDIMIPFPIRTLDFGIRGGVELSEQLRPASVAERNAKEAVGAS